MFVHKMDELLYFRIYYGIIAKLKQLQKTYGKGSKPLLDLALKRYQDEIQEAKRLYQPSIVSSMSTTVTGIVHRFSLGDICSGVFVNGLSGGVTVLKLLFLLLLLLP